MRLLIVTQKVNKNDPILGFFHRWIIEFAKHCESVVVICLEEGVHELPANVRVLSLGKESQRSDWRYITAFYRYIWQERKNYDAVFVHMNPIYVVLGGFIWKVLGKHISLWYTHRNVDVKLRIAEKLADTIFTASKEGFGLESKKVMVTGHGIDTKLFGNVVRSKALGIEPISIVSVGRITPIKDPITLIKAAEILKDTWKKRFTVTFIGSPVADGDKEYAQKVRESVKSHGLDGIVSFVGDVKPADMPALYASADISVNLAPTGGLDKVVLESMAAGVPVLTSNEAFKEYFELAGQGLADGLIFERQNAQDLADKIMRIIGDGGMNSVDAIGPALQTVARSKADISNLISAIIPR